MPGLPQSLPQICVALGFSTRKELARAAEREYKDGSNFFEVRLDHLQQPRSGIEFIRDFSRSHPEVSLLATCRAKANRGHFDGSVQEQFELLAAAANAGADLLDIEIESAAHHANSVKELRPLAAVMVSYHNFETTPALSNVLRKLCKVPADLYKIATTVRKPSDNLRLLEFCKQSRNVPLVLLGMSETGLPSRVLGLCSGSRFTFAAPAEGEGTASGQIPARSIRSLYRGEKLSKSSKIYGVIADPVRHSKSPHIHNRAFQARRLDSVYLPFLVDPKCLHDWMTFADRLPVAGFSVTIPHKQKIMRYLDIIDPLAKRIGAVNTVWRKAGKWRGTNTDIQGVLRPLAKHIRLPRATILIAGYGGAARAAAIALHDAGAQVTITGRDLKRAQALARVVKADAIDLKEVERGKYDALVQATPVGMWPNTDATLFPTRVPADVVLDMVYNPEETLLLKHAREQGSTVIPGTEMLLEQAAWQFEIWTGETAPRSAMRSALLSHT
jgi:3-dehydroquinate dehydratase / shikimate dehydrogenase